MLVVTFLRWKSGTKEKKWKTSKHCKVLQITKPCLELQRCIRKWCQLFKKSNWIRKRVFLFALWICRSKWESCKLKGCLRCKTIFSHKVTLDVINDFFNWRKNYFSFSRYLGFCFFCVKSADVKICDVAIGIAI